MNLVDDANVLCSIEKTCESAYAANRFWVCNVNRAENISFDDVRIYEGRRLIRALRALAPFLEVIDGIGSRQLAKQKPCGFVRRSRPRAQVVPVLVIHSSPMSHACSRSFLE